MENDKGIAFKIGYFIGTIACRFIGAGFLMWGWNTVASHLNAPIFTYWETFAIYMGLNVFARTFRAPKCPKKDV
jgi:hypothetical protein